MLNPYVYLEAFGLATAEALACGTPVVTPRWGAGPEIIEEGVSGYSGENVEEWAEALKPALSLNRAACRARARLFDVEHMVRSYEEAVEQLIADSRSDIRREKQPTIPANTSVRGKRASLT